MSWWIAGAAAVGAIADRKKPLRGAAMGAGLMATGGAAAGAMGGGAAAAGAGGAAAGGAAAGTGATAAGTTAAGTTAGGGLLSGSTAASAAPWVDGAGTIAGQAAGSGSGAIGGLAPQTGLLASANSALTQYKPMIDAAGMGVQMSGLLDPQQQDAPAPVPEQMQGGSQTLATIAAQGAPATVQAGMQERMRRRAMLRGGV